MTKLTQPFRRATSEDASEMAELVNIAGDGLSLYLWAKSAPPGQSAWDVGRERARLGLGGFAFHYTVVREEQGKVAACLTGCPLSDAPPPPDGEIPPPVVPLLNLQSLVPTSWYINVLATFPQHRGKGFGTELLRIAEAQARDAGNTSMSLIRTDVNTGAQRLYEKNGYAEHATRPIVKEDWEHEGQNWVLMVKSL
ncbi:MAG: GNAT family N-acetyltransferase [Phycisphaerales bacterium]|nr:GNAT family N-acetyltransferase [Phycisphaerales bacterium]